MKNRYFLIVLSLAIIMSPLIVAEENNLDISNGTISELNVTEQANCSEQLEICVGEYNALLETCRGGAWCGTGFQMVKDFNQQLSEENKDLQKKVDAYKRWKVISFILLALMFLETIIFFAKNSKTK